MAFSASFKALKQAFIRVINEAFTYKWRLNTVGAHNLVYWAMPHTRMLNMMNIHRDAAVDNVKGGHRGSQRGGGGNGIHLYIKVDLYAKTIDY